MIRFAEYVINMEQLSLEAPEGLLDVVLMTGNDRCEEGLLVKQETKPETRNSKKRQNLILQQNFAKFKILTQKLHCL